MAPPEPPRDKELITLKQVEEYATLSPLRFKATVNLINDFVAANEDACADSPRQWSKSNWRELSVLFVAEHDHLWHKDRENIRVPKQEDEDEMQGVATAGDGNEQRNAGEGNDVFSCENDREAETNADQAAKENIGSSSIRQLSTANKKGRNSSTGFPMIDLEDALIFPRDADAITFLVFNLLKLTSQKYFSAKLTAKRESAHRGPVNSSDEEEREEPQPPLKKRRGPKPKAKPDATAATKDNKADKENGEKATTAKQKALQGPDFGFDASPMGHDTTDSEDGLVSDEEQKEPLSMKQHGKENAPVAESDLEDEPGQQSSLLFSIPGRTDTASASVNPLFPGRERNRIRKVVKKYGHNAGSEDVVMVSEAPTVMSVENTTPKATKKLENVNLTLYVTIGPATASAEEGDKGKKAKAHPKTMISLMQYQGWKQFTNAVLKSLVGEERKKYAESNVMVVDILKKSGKIEPTQMRVAGMEPSVVEHAFGKALGGCVDAGMHLTRDGGEVDGFVRGEDGEAHELEVNVRFE